jgi:hypothetical protein
MDMVRHSTCRDEPARMVPKNAANVLKQARLYVGRDPRLTMFRAEDNVAMECGERLWHWGSRAQFRA